MYSKPSCLTSRSPANGIHTPIPFACDIVVQADAEAVRRVFLQQKNNTNWGAERIPGHDHEVHQREQFGQRYGKRYGNDTGVRSSASRTADF
jgi:hypothetical protein